MKMTHYDSLTYWEIQRELRGSYMGRDVIYFPEVTSTQDHAKLLAMAGAGEGTLIIADHQTEGRGRLGRSWLSPPGTGIYMTVILRPPVHPHPLVSREREETVPVGILPSHLTLLAAVAAASGVREVTQLPVTVKWANDLMLREKKVGGILIECGMRNPKCLPSSHPSPFKSMGEGGNGFAAIGIGINVNTPAEAFAEELLDTATSLLIESGRTFRREEIVREILHQLEEWYERLKSGKFVALLSAYKALDCIVGKEVVVTQGGKVWEGVAEDITRDGSLLLRTALGKLIPFIAGDVTLRVRDGQPC